MKYTGVPTDVHKWDAEEEGKAKDIREMIIIEASYCNE